jgi:hypothetical protein
MLTFQELVKEIKQRSLQERLALLEEVAHSLREEITPTEKPTPEELGWPPGFFEQTYGMFKDDPLERLPAGNYEVREEIL